MGSPLLLNDNFFSIAQYAGHTVDAEEEALGFESWRVATGRRSQLNRWEATTANSDTWLRVRCGDLRVASMIVLDRGHNLTGKTVRVQASNDNFTSWETLVDTTIPSVPGGTLDGAYGAVTEEGAWLKRFPATPAEDWRVFIPAMGAGLIPKIVGCYLGVTWEPEWTELPYEEDGGDVFATVTEGESGWQGNTRAVLRRSGIMVLPLGDVWKYEEGRRHLEQFSRRAPTWLLYDDEQPERAILAIRPPGARVTFAITPEWGYRKGTLPWIEHEPKVTG